MQVMNKIGICDLHIYPIYIYKYNHKCDVIRNMQIEYL